MTSFTFETQRPVYQMSVTWCFVLLGAICCSIGVPMNKIPKMADPLKSASDSSAMPGTTKQLKMTTVHLGSLLDAGHGAVVTLVAGNTRLAAHRAVLEAGSPVLAAMVRLDTLEASGSEVEIADVEGPVLRQLVAFLYTGRAPQLPGVTPQLLAAAEKYGVAALKYSCEQHMPDRLTVENAAATALLALRDRCHSLMRAAVTFINDHVEVMVTQGWAEAVYNHPSDVVNLIRLLAQTSATATADSTASSTATPATTSAETRPHSDQCQTAATAGRHTLPPDAAAVYHLPASATVSNTTTSTAATTATPATADSTSTSTAATPAAPMGCLNTQLPDAEAVSSFRSLSGEQKRMRLMQAARDGTEQEVRALLAVGAEVGARDGSGLTALHWAAERGHVCVVQCLLRAGAEVDARDTWQFTPLHRAAQKGGTAVLRLLLASSADVGARNWMEWTPLHYAASDGQPEAVAALIEAGADRGAMDSGGRTPLKIARQYNHQKVIQMLQ